VAKATSAKGNLAKGLRRRVMMKELQKSAAPEVGHGKSEIQLRVNKVAQNLHVSYPAVEAVKERFDPGFKHTRFCAIRRPAGGALHVAQCFLVLEKYVH
jgi:hypothetical protein